MIGKRPEDLAREDYKLTGVIREAIHWRWDTGSDPLEEKTAVMIDTLERREEPSAAPATSKP